MSTYTGNIWSFGNHAHNGALVFMCKLLATKYPGVHITRARMWVSNLEMQCCCPLLEALKKKVECSPSNVKSVQTTVLCKEPFFNREL